MSDIYLLFKFPFIFSISILVTSSMILIL